jgi:adenine C2-methylase RlmN of 23S rRNA A2503 and tRNA A37
MSDPQRPDLLSLVPQELRAVLEQHFASRGQPGYRAGQVARWVYEGLARDFGEMTNLPLGERERSSSGSRRRSGPRSAGTAR